NAGYRYVGRYLSGTIGGGISKALSKEEIEIAYSNGLKIFPIQQSSANTVAYFTEEQGISDANSAYDHAINLSIPSETIIYFAVDCDPQDWQITDNILPYFEKVKETMDTLHDGKYKIGVYGTRNVCTRVSNNDYAVSSFVGDMSTGFSGNLGFKIPENWAFDQFSTVTIGTGIGQIEIDKDGYSGANIGINNDVLDSVTKVYNNLSSIYDIAMIYTNNNTTQSNLLTLQYLRKRGGYGSTYSSGDMSIIKWNTVAGTIDEVFCLLVEGLLGKVDLDFIDPTVNIPYDLTHFGATLNSTLYPVAGLDLDGFNEIVDIFSGWGGDMVSYANNVESHDGDGVQEWANNNICRNSGTNFDLEDYLCDLDAVNIANLMDTNSLSLPEAFLLYFDTIDTETGKLYAATRTTRYIDSITFNYFLTLCLEVTADEFPMNFLRSLLINDDVTQTHVDIAMGAFVQFVYDEYMSGR
ncbi:MAG: DUF1906 domain-containing protein, partial [Bacilli bacterium]|nr:DUF1906 domain-containing protein [Bacilli bacterium]